MEIERSPLGQSLSDKMRAAELRWRGKPPGLSPEMADEFMARIVAGETIRDLTNPVPVVDPAAPYIPPMVSADRLRKHCEKNPGWAAKVRKLSWENFAKKSRKSSYWRRRTAEMCLKGLHPMSGDNVRIDPSRGRRACLACRRMSKENPPLIEPEVVAKIKQALEAGASIAQICYGRPVGGGQRNRSAMLANSQKFYHHRRVDPEFNRFVLSHVADSMAVGQQIRWRRFKTRAQTSAARNEKNDYHAIRAMIPPNFPDRDDIVARIFEDILSGAIRREDVSSRIRHYITEHNRLFPTNFAKFGSARLVSLDEVLFEDGSTTRGDTVSRRLWD